MLGMAESDVLYNSRMKSEPMSPTLHPAVPDEGYHNGIHESSDFSDNDSTKDAPIDFSLHRRANQPSPSERTAPPSLQNVDSTSTNSTYLAQFSTQDVCSSHPSFSETPLDIDSESSSSSFTAAVKQRLEQLASRVAPYSLPMVVPNKKQNLPHLPSSSSSLTSTHRSPTHSQTSTNLPPLSALYEKNSSAPNISLSIDTATSTKTTLPPDINSLQLPLSYFGVPGFTSFRSITPATLANINKTTEELYDMYKNQLHKIQSLEAKKRYRGLGNLGMFATPCPLSPPALSPDAPLSLNHPQLSPESPRHLSSGSNSSGVSTTSSLARRRPRSLPDDQKDDAYWERRRKNNEAAKRSRDTRRAKEDEIAIRAALLEQENIRLRVELAALKTETAKLRYRLYNSN